MFRNPKIMCLIARLLVISTLNLALYPLNAGAQVHRAMERAGLLQQQIAQRVQGKGTLLSPYVDEKTEESKKNTPAQQFSQLLVEMQDVLKVVSLPMVDPKTVAKHAKLPADAISANSVETKNTSQSPELAPKGQNALAPKLDLKLASVTNIPAQMKLLDEKHRNILAIYEEIERQFKNEEQALLVEKDAPEKLRRHHAMVSQYIGRKNEFESLIGKIKNYNLENKVKAFGELDAFLKKYPNSKPHQPTNPDSLPTALKKYKLRNPYLPSEQPQAKSMERKFGKVISADTELAGFNTSNLNSNSNGAPSNADVIENEDVQITPAIKSMAMQLNRDPVTIYNWVRNNILYIPTYGSIQGSDATLLTRRGNAFDTASLLIALLRVSGYGARYAYGTIEVPSQATMNWLGGVSKAEYAQELLSQGGIPNYAIMQGGRIDSFRMEHVWVEAFLDFIPSRGAVNKKPQTWVPMDASFKQFEFNQGINLNRMQKFDGVNLLEKLQQGAIVNRNFSQHINVASIPTEYTQYVAQIDAKFSASGTSPQMDDLLGSPKVIVQSSGYFQGTLPYSVAVHGAKFSQIPEAMRRYVKISLFSSVLDREMDVSSLSYRLSLPMLGLKRMGIRYLPASEVDKKIIQEAQDKNAKFLPAYLINVIPTLELDGQSVASGATVKMGTTQLYSVLLSDPHNMNITPTDFKRTAGDEIVIGVNSAGVNEQMIRARFTAYPNQSTAAENLFQSALAYWLLSDTHNWKLSQQYGVVGYRLPSVGFFSSALSVNYFFGIAQKGSYKGRSMDVPSVLQTLSGAEDEIKARYLFHAGIHGSMFEGLTFDLLFGNGLGRSVSAVQLLKVANDQGQKIYLIDAENASVVLPMLSVSSDVKQDIQNALNSGKQVMIPEREVSFHSYKGTGYIIKDKFSGAAAFMIEGGLNGGTECAKDKVAEKSSASVSQMIGSGLLATAQLLLAIALVIAVLGAVIMVIGAVAAALEVIGVVVAGVVLLLSFVAVPAMAANEPRPPFVRNPDGTLEPPGRCTPSQYSALKATKDAACNTAKGQSCKKIKPSDISCGDLKVRITAIESCIAGRQAIIFACFESGDAGHWEQIAELQNSLGYCNAIYNIKDCANCK